MLSIIYVIDSDNNEHFYYSTISFQCTNIVLSELSYFI